MRFWEGGEISGSGLGSVSSGSPVSRRLSGVRRGSRSGSGISSGSGLAGRPGEGGSAGRVLPGGACSGGSNSLGTVPGIWPACSNVHVIAGPIRTTPHICTMGVI